MNGIRPVLLAEDDEVDQQAMKRCFKELHIKNALVVTSNGEEALAYLRDGKREKPCLILLDLKMPQMDGIEFLREVKGDEKLKAIPVVVLTTSELERDRTESFKLSVAGYMIKPPEHLKLVNVVRTIDLYWGLSQFPPES